MLSVTNDVVFIPFGPLSPDRINVRSEGGVFAPWVVKQEDGTGRLILLPPISDVPTIGEAGLVGPESTVARWAIIVPRNMELEENDCGCPLTAGSGVIVPRQMVVPALDRNTGIMVGARCTISKNGKPFWQ